MSTEAPPLKEAGPRTVWYHTWALESYTGRLDDGLDKMVSPDPGKLREAANHAEDISDRGISTTNTRALVEMRNALIRLEKVAKEAREQAIEPALDEKIEVGDTVAGVRRVSRERPTVRDKAAALEVLEAIGVDPAEVMKIEPYSFADAIDGTEVDASEIIEYEEDMYYQQTTE